MLHATPTDSHPVPLLTDLRQTLEHSVEQTILDLMDVRFPAKSDQTLDELLAVAARLHEIGEWLVCDVTWLGRSTVIEADRVFDVVDHEETLADLQARVPGLRTAADLEAASC